MIRLAMVTMDTPDARALSAWWAERLGGSVTSDVDGWFCAVEAAEIPVTLGFQKVSDATPGKNRIHLDLSRTPDVDRESMIAEWTTAGATHLGARSENGFRWDVFADPDGNQFCIGESH